MRPRLIVAGVGLIFIIARYNDKKMATYTVLKEFKKVVP
jgi:hypothetical protein